MNLFSTDNLHNVLVILIDIVGIFLALWVFLASPKEKVNQGFLLMVVGILSWITFYHLASVPGFRGESLLLFRLATGSVFAFFIGYYFFVVEWFLGKIGVYKFLGKLVLGYGLLFGTVAVFSNSIIYSLRFDNFVMSPVFSTWGWLVFYGHVIALTVLINVVLIRSYAESTPEKKIKIQYFLTGLIIFAVLNFTFNVILPVFLKNYQFYYLGNYSTVFLIGFTAYAVMKRGLFNIKVIATESTVIILSLALLFEIFVSNSLNERAIKAIIWLLVTYGGYALVKSVKKEIEQKEHIQKLADELKLANEKLKELDEQKDNFISMASHELNTPIAAIEGYLSMILDEKMGGEIPEKAKKYLDSVYISSKRLAALVKDLLNVSRIESNRIHIIYEEAQIENVIEQSIMEVNSKIREARHTLSYEKPKTAMPKTWFDVSRITEVIINLLGNSIKYTEPGGKINVKITRDEKFITVSVADNGKGIPAGKADKLFEKFNQVDVLKDEIKGTGLGLFISKNLVELQGGKIWFESEGEGKGTTFYFSVPIHKEKPIDEHEGEGAVLRLK